MALLDFLVGGAGAGISSVGLALLLDGVSVCDLGLDSIVDAGSISFSISSNKALNLLLSDGCGCLATWGINNCTFFLLFPSAKNGWLLFWVVLTPGWGSYHPLNSVIGAIVEP